MISDFLLPWLKLNLLSLSSKHQEKLFNSGIPREIVLYFEYRKSKEGYWTGKHLLNLII